MSSKKPLIVITGASAGIGLALAKQFVLTGHPCLLISRHMKAIPELKGHDIIYAALDVTDYERFEAEVRKAEQNTEKQNVWLIMQALLMWANSEIFPLIKPIMKLRY
ncbi:short chain dehydrogenase [Legionella brunensis]|uniref:Short chain dehydrogenase n=1 Tax=Legionella brunensis TaxID=29422 RepID=A0A0W0SN58_9GAMM|nr:SDR family NAD(P)-dependent oxidoreductase [Legionella brunensis]KTC84822.1 short chain dehydrogenase [Legionella brunensis]